MIGLDTNILVRYITQDDEAQAALANRLIEASCTKQTPGHVAQIVLCELVWVLCRAYGYGKQQIIPVIERLLSAAEIEVQHEGIARAALEAWRNGPADYSDYLIALANQAAGCEVTYSFDSRLAQHPGVAIPA